MADAGEVGPASPRSISAQAVARAPATQKAIEANASLMKGAIEQLETMVNATTSVASAVRVYRNQSVILHQTRSYEDEALRQLLAELHGLQRQCNEIKRSMKSQRLEQVASLNDELSVAEARLTSMRELSVALDNQIAEADTTFALLEQQLRLTDTEMMKSEKKRDKSVEQALSQVVSGKQSLLANNVLFANLRSMPVQGDVDRFLHDQAAKMSTVEQTVDMSKRRNLLANYLPPIAKTPTR